MAGTLKLRTKIGYSLGDMGLSISYFTLGFFFIYYLTDIVGLQPYLAGLAYFIGNAWDSVNDPLVGALNDRLHSSGGRKRAFMLYGALPFAISFMLLWLVPLEGSQTLKFSIATLAMLLYATFYSLVEVPYMALVPVMTRDYDERTQIVGIRAILSTVGTLLGAGAAMLVSGFDSELTGLRVMAAGFAGWVLLTILIAAASVRGIEAGPAEPLAPKESWRGFLRLLRDRTVMLLMVFKFLGAVATGSLIASLPYFSKYILGDESRSTIGVGLYIAVAAACIPLWERLSRRHDKRRLLFGAMLAMGVLLFAIGLLTGSGTIAAFYAGCALLGTMMSAYLLLGYSFPPDLVDHHQLQTGERQDSAIFGLWVTSHQLGIACAGLVLGFVLQAAGYDAALDKQTPAALTAVRLSLGLLPGVFMLAAVTVLQKYPITRAVYDEIRLALQRPPVSAPGRD